MKKITYSRFGGADVLEMTDTEIPVINKTSLLIKVKAVSVNPLDWKIRNGEMKLMSGTKFPKGTGIDFSGIVEQTGEEITKYQKGDEVFGLLDVFTGSALSEYIIVTEKDIATKPGNISFEQAAAIPVVGSAAIQIFETLVQLTKGTGVLINGASGGIGMFATQMAKMKGATVTTVVSSKGIPFAKKWGADHVIDYEKDNIFNGNRQYDIIIDLSGKMPFNKAKPIMKPSSAYIHTAPGPKEILTSFFINLFSNKKYKLLMLKPSALYLEALAAYASKGMDIVVSKTYPFNLFKEAYTEVPKGHFIGKAVITVAG